jgi:aryl-alcohol dehydrogenase-like predicted oxidoreductase
VITRKLGSNGPEISVIGLGAWAMGGGGWFASWGPQDDELSVRTVQAALDAGVTWIDTAPIYGLGHSEEVVGKAIAGRRDEVLVATKCTNRWQSDRTPVRTGARESILRECDESLARLGIDRIDLLQVHSPPPDVPLEETWGALAELQDAGKARWLGLSNASVEEHQRCEAIRHVDSSQPHYNLLLRDIETELLDHCAAAGTGVIPYGPMYEGLLSGTFDPARLQGDDFRKQPEWQPRIEHAARAVEALRPLAKARGVTVGQLAIGWVLTHPAITSAIVGARTPEQATANAAAAPLADDPALRSDVLAAVAALG